MKKILTKTLIAILACVCMAFAFTGCKKSCKHTYDNACDTTCNKCGVTRVITHDWEIVDCDEPLTCSVCGETNGEAVGHDWSDKNGICKNNAEHVCDHGGATFDTCTTCGKNLGEPPHTHSVKKTDQLDKTCDDDGHYAYWYCESCNSYFSDEEATLIIGDIEEWKAGEGKIASSGHTAEEDDGNCTTAIKCSVCGEVAVEAKTEHKDTNGDYDCDNDGCQVVTEGAPEDDTPGIDLPIDRN